MNILESHLLKVGLSENEKRGLVRLGKAQKVRGHYWRICPLCFARQHSVSIGWLIWLNRQYDPLYKYAPAQPPKSCKYPTETTA